MADHPPLDPAIVTTLGLIVSRQEGPFRIDIASIRMAEALIAKADSIAAGS